MPKFGTFFWRMWKIKSSASSLNLYPPKQLAQVTTMEVTKMNHRSSHRRCSVRKVFLEISQDSQKTSVPVSFLLKRGQETQHNRLSSQEWSNCQNCKKMPARLECGCCHEIPEAKAFNLKDEAKLYRIYRSSFSQMFFKIGVLKNFAIYTGKHLCWSLFNKIKRLYKRGLQHRCFP